MDIIARERYTLDEVHELFLCMIREFHDFCVNNNLTYYMVGGTLLGAIRDKGFIPWDDDVDFAMPRSDYERFIQIYDGNLKLKCYKNDKKYYFPYVKLFHSDMQILSVFDSRFNIEGELFLKFDIYPIDGVGTNWEQAKIVVRKTESLKRLLYINQTRDLSKNILKRCIAKFVRIIPTSVFVRLLDKSMQQFTYEESALVTRWRMPDMLKNVVKKDIFGTPKLVEFESLQLFAPEKFDVYLKKVYGEYMTPIRENIGLRHDVSSTVITKDLENNIKGELQ